MTTADYDPDICRCGQPRCGLFEYPEPGIEPDCDGIHWIDWHLLFAAGADQLDRQDRRRRAWEQADRRQQS